MIGIVRAIFVPAHIYLRGRHTSIVHRRFANSGRAREKGLFNQLRLPSAVGGGSEVQIGSVSELIIKQISWFKQTPNLCVKLSLLCWRKAPLSRTLMTY